MYSWRIVQTGKLPKQYKRKVSMLLYRCFRAGRSSRQRAVGRDQYCDNPFAYILALEKKTLKGVVLLYKKNIKHGGKSIILGGIGGVCTKKKERKRGIATSLLKRAMQCLKSEGCDVAYLCTDVKNPENVRLYGKLGFVKLDKPYTYLGKSGKRYTERNGMVAPVRSRAKFNLIRKGKETLDLGISNW